MPAYNILYTVLVVGCLIHLGKPDNSLELLGQEIILPEPKEIFIRFKVHVRNFGSVSVRDIALRPEKCCFYEGRDKSCRVFHPVGEKLQYLEHGAHYNLTMLFANYYVLERYGECNATLSYNGQNTQRIVFGTFNTTLTESYSKLPKHLREWFTGTKKCVTFDQDIFRKCKPVNCIYKYGGLRNFFQETDQLCTKISPCYTDPKSSLPQKALDRNSNTCRDLTSYLSGDELARFSTLNENFMGNDYDTKKMKEVVCVHGKLKAGNRSCLCDHGWSTDPHDRSPYDPITQIYYLCNTPSLAPESKLKGVTAHLVKLLIFLVLLMFCACAISFLLFCCAKTYMVCKKEDDNGISKWLKDKFGEEERDESRKPLFGSAVQNQSTNAKVQRIETSWYNTEDTIYDIAVVHTKSKGKGKGELYLNAGDILTDLEKVDIPGYWKGTCRDRRGIFPVACAEFRRHGQPATALPKY